MNRYLTTIVDNAKEKNLHPLVWPALLPTLAYGIGLAYLLPWTLAAGKSSLFTSMASLGFVFPIVWGTLAVLAVGLELLYLFSLKMNISRYASFLGAVVWFFACAAYISTGEYMVLFSVALSNALFWIFIYLAQSRHRKGM